MRSRLGKFALFGALAAVLATALIFVSVTFWPLLTELWALLWRLPEPIAYFVLILLVAATMLWIFVFSVEILIGPRPADLDKAATKAGDATAELIVGFFGVGLLPAVAIYVVMHFVIKYW